MSIPISEDTPYYVLKKVSATNRDFVTLNFKASNVVTIHKNTLLQDVEKVKDQKSSPGPRTDCYIREMKCERHIPFYKLVSTERNKTYLGTKYFTIGLLRVPRKALHIIQNEAKSGPIYVYRCSDEYLSLYEGHVDSSKALVNKNSIITHFDPIVIKPGKDYTMKPHSIYFFYSVTHCKCTWIRITGSEYNSMKRPCPQLEKRSKRFSTDSSGQADESSIQSEDSLDIRSLLNRIKYLEHECECSKSRNKFLENENKKLLEVIEQSRNKNTQSKTKRIKVEPEERPEDDYKEQAQSRNETNERFTENYASTSVEPSVEYHAVAHSYQSSIGTHNTTPVVPQSQHPVSVQRNEKSLEDKCEDQRKKIILLTGNNQRLQTRNNELEKELDNLKTQHAKASMMLRKIVEQEKQQRIQMRRTISYT